MKKLVALSLLVLVAAALTFVMRPALAVTLGNNPSVTGHGNLTILGGLQTASFHATQHQNGDFTGSLVAKSRAQDARIFADIDCLTIVGTYAILSGIITQSNNPGAAVGDHVWFKVVDNGEGSPSGNDLPDQMTDVAGVPPFIDCTFDLGLPLMDIEAGNIQIRP